MTGRLHAAVFAALCAVGSVCAVGLTVREATRTAPVTVAVASTVRSGLATTVVVLLHNTTGRARCVTVKVAARDQNGRDLASVRAPGALTVPARARRRVSVRLSLTARQYAERLHAFYPSTRRC